MANLTNASPNETNSAQRFVASADRGPSFLESLANFGSNLVGVADHAINSLQRDAAQRNAGADAQAKNNAVKSVAANLFSNPSMAPNPNIPEASQGAYNNSKPLAQQAANTQAAAGQGKIDPAMAQAKSLAVFRQALASNPGHEYAVFQAFKEMGVDNMMMQQYKNAENSLESDQNAEQATMHKMEEAAVTKWGYSDYYKKEAPEKAQILATVGRLEAQEQELDGKTKLADLTLKNMQLTDTQRKATQTQFSSDLTSSFSTYMTTNFGNLSKIMINQLGDPTLASNPARLTELQGHLLNVALPTLDTMYQQKKASIMGIASPEDISRLDDQFKQQRQSLVDMISGPQSVVEMNSRVLKSVSDTMGIDYAKSAPVLMRMQKLIGPQAVGNIMSPAIMGNPALMNMIKDEMNGVLKDPRKMPSLTEFVQSLNGSIDPASWDPEKQRAAAPAALVSMNALGKDSATSNGTDKQGHQALVNSIKQTASIAVDVVPQWGFNSVLTQGKALNTRGVTTALFHTGSINQPEKIEAVHAWIPAATRTYQTLASMDSGDKYYSAKFDTHTMQWQAVWNGQKVQQNGMDYSANPGVGLKFGQATVGTVKPQATTKVLEHVATLNTMLNNLGHVGVGGFDDVLGKGVNFNEAKRYFATGELPQSLQKPAGGKDKNGKTPEQNVDDAISHMLDFVNKLPAPHAVENIGHMPLAGAVETAARKYGVPTDIALRLIHQESGGRPDVGRSSKGAVGPGQIMPKTAAAYGKDVDAMTPEENVDLAMQILADNHKNSGTWEDAVSMYHSGRKLADAVKHKSNDGNMTTLAYTAGITGAPSPISQENLARYGYVRR